MPSADKSDLLPDRPDAENLARILWDQDGRVRLDALQLFASKAAPDRANELVCDLHELVMRADHDGVSRRSTAARLLRELAAFQRVDVERNNKLLLGLFEESAGAFEKNTESVCVLFADQIDGTGYKYGGPAAVGLSKALRHNFTVEGVIESEKWHGEVAKFVGDGVMAYFTSGEGDPKDAATRAVGAAMEIIRKFRQYNQRIPEQDWPKRILTKIGIHLGPVWMMNFKQTDRVDPQGATVDLAARLCDMAPHMHAVLSKEAFEAAGLPGEADNKANDTIKWCGPEKRRIRGAKGLQQVYAITSDELLVTEIPLPGAVPQPVAHVRDLLHQARNEAKHEHVAQAMEIYRGILRIDERNFEANYYLAELLASYPDHDASNRFDEAYELLCEAKSERPHSCYVWKLLSWVQFERFLLECRDGACPNPPQCFRYLDEAIRFATHALRIAEGHADSNGAAIAKVYLTLYLTERVRSGLETAEKDRNLAASYIEECSYTFGGREKMTNLLKSNFLLAQAMSMHATHASTPNGVSPNVLDGILGLLQKAESLNKRNRLALEFHQAVLGGGKWERLKQHAGSK